jgi:hypothetical protein
VKWPLRVSFGTICDVRRVRFAAIGEGSASASGNDGASWLILARAPTKPLAIAARIKLPKREVFSDHFCTLGKGPKKFIAPLLIFRKRQIAQQYQ